MLIRPGSVGRIGQPSRTGLSFALDATGESIRAAIADISKYANGGFLLPGTAGARINAAARSSVAMERQVDGSYRYAPHNLLTYSDDLSNAAWGKTGAGTASAPTVTANYGAAPNGSMTAARVQLTLNAGTSTSDRSLLLQSHSHVAGASYTARFAIRSLSGTVSMGIGGDGLAGNTPITVTTEWQEFTFTAPATSTGSFWMQLRGGQTPVHTNSADLLVWVPTLNLGAVLLPRIPTGAAAVYAPAVSHDGTAWDVQCEPSRTNLALWNADMSNAAWAVAGTGATKVGAATALGAVPMYRLNVGSVGGTIGGASAVYQGSLTFVNGTQYTVLFVARSVSGTSAFRISVSQPADAGSPDFLATTTPTVFAHTFTAAGGVVGGNAAIRAATAGGTVGDIEVGGFSVIAGSVPATESLILTLGSTVTRAADDPLTPHTPGTSGAVIIDYVPLDSSSHVVASLSDGTSNERHTVTNDGAYTVVDGGATQASPDGGTPTVGVVNKVGFAFAANDFAVALNGATPVTDTSGTLPTVTQLSLAGGPKRVRRIRIQASKPSGAALQGMTA